MGYDYLTNLKTFLLRKTRLFFSLFVLGFLILAGCDSNTTSTLPGVAIPTEILPTMLTAIASSSPLPTATPGGLATLTPTTTGSVATATPSSLPNTPVPVATATHSVSLSAPRQIGPAGCCHFFNFAGDGRLYYYDFPSGASSAGTFILDPHTLGSAPQLLTTNFGSFTSGLDLIAVAHPGSGTTTIEQMSDGSHLTTLQNRANPVIFSPDSKHLAYLLRSTQQDGPERPQLFTLWTGDINGANLRRLWTLREGANLAWFPDNRRLLLTARNSSDSSFGLWVIDTQAAENQGSTLIVEGVGLTAASVSSDGQYIVYAISWQSAARSGVWVAGADGSNQRKLSWEGGWRWSPHDGSQLFYIPSDTRKLSIYDAQSGQTTQVTSDPLLVANDDWQISPDARSIVYRNAVDNALWYLLFRS